jgi:hypothetical protein
MPLFFASPTLQREQSHQGENMFTQMCDKKLKTTLQTFQTFITVEIRFKE